MGRERRVDRFLDRAVERLREKFPGKTHSWVRRGGKMFEGLTPR